MIKASATLPDGRKLVLLGLSSRNLELLRERKPAMINLDELGGANEVVIMWGETEQAIYDEMKGANVIGAETEIRNMPKDVKP